MRYEVRHNRENCIGCGTCVSLCPDYWEMIDDGKSRLLNAEVLKDKIGWEHTWFEIGYDCNKEAESQCPVNVIFVVD